MNNILILYYITEWGYTGGTWYHRLKWNCMENMWKSYCSVLLTCVILNRAALTWPLVGLMRLTWRRIGLVLTFLKEYTVFLGECAVILPFRWWTPNSSMGHSLWHTLCYVIAGYWHFRKRLENANMEQLWSYMKSEKYVQYCRKILVRTIWMKDSLFTKWRSHHMTVTVRMPTRRFPTSKTWKTVR